MEINPILNTIKDLSERSETIRGIFDYDQKYERLIEVNRELEDPAVWNKPEYARNWAASEHRWRRSSTLWMSCPAVWPIPASCSTWPLKKTTKAR